MIADDQRALLRSTLRGVTMVLVAVGYDLSEPTPNYREVQQQIDTALKQLRDARTRVGLLLTDEVLDGTAADARRT